MSIDTDIKRLGLGGGGLIRGFFNWVADSPDTEYEQLQAKADQRYKNREGDRKMFDATTAYLLEDEERNLHDFDLREKLEQIGAGFDNVNPIRFIRNYPIKEIYPNYDKIKTQYERTKLFHSNMAENWRTKEASLREQSNLRGKTWRDFKFQHASPESEALKEQQKEITRQRDELFTQDNWYENPEYQILWDERDRLWDEIQAVEDANWEKGKAEKERLWTLYQEVHQPMRQASDESWNYGFTLPQKLQAEPLSEQDITILLGRIKDPEHRLYASALVEDSIRQANEREEQRLDPDWKDPKLSNIAHGMSNVQPAVLAEIDRVNLSKALVDSPYRRQGFKPAWDIDKQELTSTNDPYGFESDLDAYVSDIVAMAFGKNERFSPSKWFFNKITNLVRGGRLPIQYLSFAPDQMYSMLGESDYERIAGQMSMRENPDVDRVEWDDERTKSHELLHRYFKLADFNKDGKFFGGKWNIATEEFFVRAYVSEIYGEDWNNDSFFSGLQNYLNTGGYSNYESVEGSVSMDKKPLDLTDFRRELPAMIESFEKEVAGKNYDPEFGSLVLDEILVTAPRQTGEMVVTKPTLGTIKQQGYAPPPKQSIKEVEEESLLSRIKLPIEAESREKEIRGYVPLNYRTYIDKVLLQNKEEFTEEFFHPRELENYNNQIMDEVRTHVKSGEWFINDDGKLNSLTSQRGQRGDKSLKQGYKPSFTWNTTDALYLTFGTSSFDIYKDHQEVKLDDKYDFNFSGWTGQQTEPGFNRENLEQYWTAVARTLGGIERYGAFNLPDKKTAELLQKKYDPVPVNINTVLSFSKSEWASLMKQAEVNGLKENRELYLFGPYGRETGYIPTGPDPMSD